MASVAEMRAHIERLATELGVWKVVTLPRDYPTALVLGWGDGPYTVGIHPIRSRSSYYIALHELGHVAVKRADLRQGVVLRADDSPGEYLRVEVAAWAWAMRRAIVEPSLRAREAIHRGLRSYILPLVPRPEPPTREALAAWEIRLKAGAADLVPKRYRDNYTQAWAALMGDARWPEPRHRPRRMRAEFRNSSGKIVGTVVLTAAGKLRCKPAKLRKILAATNVIAPPDLTKPVKMTEPEAYLRALPHAFRSPYWNATFVES